MVAETKRVRRERIDELVYIRAIAALGILIIHATGGFVVNSEFGSKAMFGGIFLNQFFRFGSPIFMMISGLVIFYNYRSRDGFDAPRFFKKKITYILIPYLIWSITYFLYDVFYFDLQITREMLLKLRTDIFTGGAYSHLYFIFLIFQFYLLVPLLLRFLPQQMEKRPFVVVGISFVLQLIVLLYGYYFRSRFNTGFMVTFNAYYWKTVIAWQYYFVLGGTIGVHYKKVSQFIEDNIKKILMIFLVVTVFYVGQPYVRAIANGNLDGYGKFGSIRPQTMVYATATMPVLIYITKRMLGSFNILKNFGTYSFGIYFSHPLILNEIKRVLFKYNQIFGYGRITSLFIITGLAVVLTYVFVALVGILPFRKIIIGNIPKYKLTLFRKED